MAIDYTVNKGIRLIKIYEMLQRGECVSKQDLMNEFNVTAKSIQRDIEDLRAYIADEYFLQADEVIRYSRKKKGYYLTQLKREWITSSEVMAICKVLIESRGFNKEELELLLDKMLEQVAPEDAKQVKEMINNERFLYVAPRHGKPLISELWNLSKQITGCNILEIEYQRQDLKISNYSIKPIAIMFSEYYFYLIAYIKDSTTDSPRVFRIDRIKSYRASDEKFKIPYRDRFEEGEFRKRVAFMYSGELKRIEFWFSGTSLEAILDRLPTAQVLEECDNKYRISAEVYGDGVEMWLRSQGDWVEMITFYPQK